VRQRFSGLWRRPDFLKLWAAQTVSLFGTQVTTLALPLTAVLVLDASAGQMGVLTALATLPFLLIGLFAGAWVDRMRRRPVLIAADLGRAVIFASVPLAAAMDRLTIEQLYAVALLAGTLTVFFDVAYQSYLPSLVARSELVDGNAKLEISNSTARVTGPGVGGALTQVFSAPVAILLDSFSFLVSALLLGRIRSPEAPPEKRSAGGSIWREIGEGLRVVFRHRLLRPIVASTAVSNFCSGIATAVFVLFLTRDLGLTPSVIGLTYALGSLGAVGAAFLAAPVARRYGLGPSIIGGKLLVAVAMLLLPLAGGPVLVAAAVLIVYRVLGGGAVISNVNQVSLRQTITPGRLQGRVNATNRFVTWATLPLGSLAGGLLAQMIGLRPTLFVAAAGTVLAVLWLFLSPLPSVREATAPESEEEMVAA
jgi:MFS family permease